MAQFFKDYGVVFVLLLQLTLQGLAWLRRRELPTKQDVSSVGEGVGTLRAHVDSSMALLRREIEASEDRFEKRCLQFESKTAHLPTSADVNALRLDIERVRGEMNGFNERMQGEKNLTRERNEGVQRQMQSLTGLVERAEAMLATITQHMIEKGI